MPKLLSCIYELECASALRDELTALHRVTRRRKQDPWPTADQSELPEARHGERLTRIEKATSRRSGVFVESNVLASSTCILGWYYNLKVTKIAKCR